MVFTDNFIPSTSSSPPHEPDDISAFLRHLLHRSSSSAPPSSPPPPPLLFLPTLPSHTTVETHAGDNNNSINKKTPFSFSSTTITNNFLPTSGPSAVFSGSDRLVVDRISPNAVVLSSSSPTGYFPAVGGGSHEYTEDCDYESEEGAEAVAEGVEARQTPLRNQSKRTRAAEVHNLSEKRRRSRINEKMKALQNLIPNSNKTDKASMLDEAIEYLKQLQLQVQMLSMRNGLSLHPMCLPEDQEIMHATQLPQIGMHNLSNSSASFDPISITNSVNMIPDASHSTFDLAYQCGSSGRTSLPRVSNVINSEATAFGLESSVHSQFRLFKTLNSPRQTVCREQNVPQERSFINKHEMKSSVTTMPLSFGAGDSNVEEYNSLGVHTQAKYGPQGTLLDSFVGQNQRTSSIFSSLHSASSSARNDKLTIGR